MDRESAAQLSRLQCTSAVCQSADIDLTDSVDVSSLKAEGDGWRAEGIVHIDYCAHGRCRTCGRVFEAARNRIPVQFPELTCLECERAALLQYRVEEMTSVEEGFEFRVAVRCSGCRAKKVLRRLLTGLLGAVSIEVGLTGITLRRNPSAPAA